MKNRMQRGAFHFEEDIFIKNAEGVSKLCHEVSFLKKFLQIKPQLKSMFGIYYDLYYTVIKNRDDKEIVNEY